MTRNKDGQAFVPGFLAAAASTPIMTDGELPGGGALFRDPVSAPVEHQLPLVISFGGVVIHRTDKRGRMATFQREDID